ncbi:M48 family metallopeptidase [Elusimicrobiota bacterium]
MHSEIDPQKQNIAKKYFLTNFYISKTDTVISLLVLILVIAAGYSLKLSLLLKSYHVILYRSIYFTAFYTLFFAVSWPFSYISSYKIEHKYDFSNQSFKEWLIDQIKGYFVSLVLGLIIVNVFYFIVNLSPGLWWFWVGLVMILFSVILQHLAPVILIPIFYKLEPLEDETLKSKLLDLAGKAKVRVIGIFNIKLSEKTKKANAALTGLGSTRRMLLGDTLIKNYDQEEIETVIAHELGHHIHHHILKLMAFGGVLTMLSAYILFRILPAVLNILDLGAVGDIASFPGLVLVSGTISFFFNPLSNYFSRILETQADDTAVNLSMKPEKFISTMSKFANLYLSYAYPPKLIEWLEYNHPPIGKRIERVRNSDPTTSL